MLIFIFQSFLRGMICVNSNRGHTTADAATTLSVFVKKIVLIYSIIIIIGPLSLIGPHSSVIQMTLSHGEPRNPRVSPRNSSSSESGSHSGEGKARRHIPEQREAATVRNLGSSKYGLI